MTLSTFLSSGDTTSVCSVSQLQCLSLSSESACSDAITCSWCDFDGFCIPQSSCFSAQTLAVTPYYCPTQACDTGAVFDCSNLTAADCSLDARCQFCNGACSIASAELCSQTNGAQVMVVGEGQCPSHFTRQFIPTTQCTALQSLCLMQTTERGCSSLSSCSWCSEWGACMPQLSCIFEPNQFVYGSATCGTGECPFEPPTACLSIGDMANCTAARAEAGVPCQWCSVGDVASCLYSPSVPCTQTLSDRQVVWGADSCESTLASFVSAIEPECLVPLNITVRSQAEVQIFLNGTLLGSASIPDSEQAEKTGVCSQSELAACRSSRVAVADSEIPCAASGSVIAVVFDTQDDLPTAAISGVIQIGARVVHTEVESHAWICQAVGVNASVQVTSGPDQWVSPTYRRVRVPRAHDHGALDIVLPFVDSGLADFERHYVGVCHHTGRQRICLHISLGND